MNDATRRFTRIGSLGAAFGLGLPRASEDRAAEERAVLRLAAVCSSEVLDAAVAEAERRALVLTERARTSRWSPAFTPRCAAYESVTDDLLAARFG